LSKKKKIFIRKKEELRGIITNKSEYIISYEEVFIAMNIFDHGG
jgi:hypothetical protein